jgi:hypothetical protein
VSEDLGTLERRTKGGLVIKNHHDHKGFVVGKGAAVEHPTLIEQLFENGFLGRGNEARRRKEAGLMLTDLMGWVYRSEGVAGYSVVSSADYEMTDEEDRLRTTLHKIMRQINLCDWRLLKIMCHVEDRDHIELLAMNMVGEREGYQRALDKLAEVIGIG